MNTLAARQYTPNRIRNVLTEATDFVREVVKAFGETKTQVLRTQGKRHLALRLLTGE